MYEEGTKVTVTLPSGRKIEGEIASDQGDAGVFVRHQGGVYHAYHSQVVSGWTSDTLPEPFIETLDKMEW